MLSHEDKKWTSKRLTVEGAEIIIRGDNLHKRVHILYSRTYEPVPETNSGFSGAKEMIMLPAVILVPFPVQLRGIDAV